MNKLAAKHAKQTPVQQSRYDPLLERANKPDRHRKRSELLPWLVGGLSIFAVLYGTSYLALSSLPPYKGVDMRSQLTADYRDWEFLMLQPVDPSVIEEIRQERGLPEQIIVDGSFWPASHSANVAPAATSEMQVPTSPVTLNTPLSNVTATPLPYTSTPVPTNTIWLTETAVTLQGMKTPIPTDAVHPTNTSKPRKTPKHQKTSKPPKDPKH